MMTNLIIIAGIVCFFLIEKVVAQYLGGGHDHSHGSHDHAHHTHESSQEKKSEQKKQSSDKKGIKEAEKKVEEVGNDFENAFSGRPDGARNTDKFFA